MEGLEERVHPRLTDEESCSGFHGLLCSAAKQNDIAVITLVPEQREAEVTYFQSALIMQSINGRLGGKRGHIMNTRAPGLVLRSPSGNRTLPV